MKPWENEGNYHEIDFEGYKGFILRNHILKNLNGYVVIGEEPPLYGKDMYDPAVSALACHWGITYSKPHLGFNRGSDDIFECVRPDEKKWVLGFDTGHCEDLVPALDSLGLRHGLTYRTKEYVENNIKALILQLKEMEIKNVDSATE